MDQANGAYLPAEGALAAICARLFIALTEKAPDQEADEAVVALSLRMALDSIEGRPERARIWHEQLAPFMAETASSRSPSMTLRDADKALCGLALAWNVAERGLRRMVGLPESEGSQEALVSEQVSRDIEALMAMREALVAHVGLPDADLWPSTPNRHPYFAGASPLDLMRDGGSVTLRLTSRLVQQRATRAAATFV